MSLDSQPPQGRTLGAAPADREDNKGNRLKEVIYETHRGIGIHSSTRRTSKQNEPALNRSPMSVEGSARAVDAVYNHERDA